MGDLDVPMSVQEDVSELEIAVDDLVPVQIARGLQDLQHVPPRLVLREALGLAEKLRQRLNNPKTCIISYIQQAEGGYTSYHRYHTNDIRRQQ